MPAPQGQSSLCQPPAPGSAGSGPGWGRLLGCPPHTPRRPEATSQQRQAGPRGGTAKGSDACRMRPPISPTADALSSVSAGMGCGSSPPPVPRHPDPAAERGTDPTAAPAAPALAGSSLPLYEGGQEPRHERLCPPNPQPRRCPSPGTLGVHHQPQGLGAPKWRA